MNPYVWKGDSGFFWYLARGKDSTAILKSESFNSWQEAMDAAHALIAREPS